jgi:hypothetical protein
MLTAQLRGPDVAVIGHIPYYDQLADLPIPHNYGEKQLAMRLLFNSGNPPPHEVFRDYGHFRQYLEGTKEFRGALALRNVFLDYEDDGSTPRITYAPPYLKPGYTPMRAVVRGADLAPLPLYLPGDGGRSEQRNPLPGNTGAQVTLRVNFKLSFWFDLFCRATYGYWAPDGLDRTGLPLLPRRSHQGLRQRLRHPVTVVVRQLAYRAAARHDAEHGKSGTWLPQTRRLHCRPRRLPAAGIYRQGIIEDAC